MMRTLAYSMLTVILAMTVSCVPGPENQDFVKVEERDFLDRFSFTLDMSDSLSLYDLDIFTRIDCTQEEFRSMGDIPVSAFYVSPSGTFYTEDFTLPVMSFFRSTTFTKDYIIHYRDNLAPVESGRWKLFLSIPDEFSDRVRGMGVIFRKDGKR